MTEADLLLVGQPTPDGLAVDRNELVVALLLFLRIEVERPIDPDRRIPLLLLALVIQGEQLGALVFIFPGERGLSLALEGPPGLLDGQLIAVHRSHVSLLSRLSRRLGLPLRPPVVHRGARSAHRARQVREPAAQRE